MAKKISRNDPCPCGSGRKYKFCCLRKAKQPEAASPAEIRRNEPRDVVRRVWPHEFFRLDFDKILEEGRRQEEVNTANKGEYAIVQNMHIYFSEQVLPLVIHNDWVFEAALKFAIDYALDCFRYLRLGGREILDAQKRLHVINDRVTDFLARASLAGGAPIAGTVNLIKASDFIDLLELDKLSKAMRLEATRLRQQAQDYERLQLEVTLRAIRDNYVRTLPRIMYVVRRSIKVALGLPETSGDNELLEISESLNWYESHISSSHRLYPVLGELRDFYRVARNACSHSEGMGWDPASNEVILFDKKKTLRVDLYRFQQWHRYLAVYLCDLGLRGILSAFCERERGLISNNLVEEYVKIFPEDFPPGEQGIVRFYP